MADDRLTTLYEWSDQMTKAGKDVKEKHEGEYKKIIEYLKTSEVSKERVFAAQLIARFFRFFPEHEHDAFDSIVDLCESADVDVRKHATMAMMTICRDSKQVVSKAADILIQLYQTNQASEVNLINTSLTNLLKYDIEKFLKSFFANFEDGSEIVRERALKFLAAKIHMVDESALTKEIEEQLMNYTKKSMEDVTKEEFITFIGILGKLKIAKTNSGQATIVSAIKSQAEMQKEFDVNDKDALDKFILCAKHTIPFLSQYNRASEYVNYICLKVLPHLKELSPTGKDLVILQALAEMSPHIIVDDAPKLIDLDSCVTALYKKLLEYLPEAPDVAVPMDQTVVQDVAEKKEKTDDEATTNEEANKDDDSNANDESKQETPAEVKPADAELEKPAEAQVSAEDKTPAKKQAEDADFQFTHIEYLMYAFIQLCRLKPELYSAELQAESRKQLSHLSNGCKKYTNILEKQLSGVKAQDLNSEENKLRNIALRTTKNISTMIIGLFKRPSDFRVSIILSCKPQPIAANKGSSNNNNNTSNNNSKSNQTRPAKRPYFSNGDDSHKSRRRRR